MLISLISAGQHPHSNTYEVAKYLAECFELEGKGIQFIDLNNLEIKDCIGCDYCLAHQGECIIKDDDMIALYQAFNNSEIVIFISPVYFSNIPGALKRVIDRCQLFYNLKDKSSVKPKVFAAIHLGGAPKYEGQFTAFETTYRVLLPDLRGQIVDLVEISNTDRIAALDRSDVLSKIKALPKQLETAYKNLFNEE